MSNWDYVIKVSTDYEIVVAVGRNTRAKNPEAVIQDCLEEMARDRREDPRGYRVIQQSIVEGLD